MRFVVDVYGEKDGLKLFEIEERRRAPVQNVAKIVKWVYQSRRSHRVTLVHIFFHEFYGKREHRAEEDLARFVGILGTQLLSGRFEYVPLHTPMHQGSGGAQDRNRFRDIAQSIVERLSSDRFSRDPAALHEQAQHSL